MIILDLWDQDDYINKKKHDPTVGEHLKVSELFQPRWLSPWIPSGYDIHSSPWLSHGP